MRNKIMKRISDFGNKLIFKKLVWGFTLMELLLSITLFSVIAVTMYSALATGLKIHKKGVTIGGEYNDIRLIFNRITQDLRMAIGLNEVYLEKESQGISFFSCQLRQGGGTEIYKITYKWNKVKGGYILYRIKETYADSLQDTYIRGDELLSNIEELKFNYGYSKKNVMGEDTFFWKSEWEEEALPKMVKFEVKISDVTFEEMIFCPAGKIGEVKED